MNANTSDNDWNPETYARFRDLRLRPALDLLLAVRSVGGGDVIDLGCGTGAMGARLRERFSGHRVIGVDSSPAMLAKAEETGAYDELIETDIEDWRCKNAGLIFSNAALHWLGDHDTLFPHLAGMLAQGGTLAVQMPHQNNAPSHRVWRDLAAELAEDEHASAQGPGVAFPAHYFRLLSGFGALSIWETEYYQLLAAEAGAHPVRRFTESTYARPILSSLDEEQRRALVARYEDVMEKAYPRGEDGTVLFPFKRMFFTLTV